MKSSRSPAFVGKRDARAAGARARSSGQDLERAIMAVNRWYDDRGEAAIEKVNAPTAGWGASLRVLPSTVDFNGTFLKGGRVGIAFDTKSVSGAAQFGIDHLPKGKHEARHRARFKAQVEYLRGLRERHDYTAFFLLYCSELDTVWVCRDLDALVCGQSVPVRTKHRASGGTPVRIEHHLPQLSVTGHAPTLLGIAATTNPHTGRPYLDYLSLIR